MSASAHATEDCPPVLWTFFLFYIDVPVYVVNWWNVLIAVTGLPLYISVPLMAFVSVTYTALVSILLYVVCCVSNIVCCETLLLVLLCFAPNALHTILRNFSGETVNLLRTCCRLVSDTANKSAKSRCNGIWETTRHNRLNGLLPSPTSYGLATGKLMLIDFGL